MTRLPPRPRDDLGRPLARDSGVDIEPDPTPLPAAETLDVAQRLLEGGRAFRAHEVLEARWKSAPADERELWRGLAQLAVGITHHQRGNATGRESLLLRAAKTLEPYAGQLPYDVAVDDLRAWAAEAAPADDLPPVPPLRRQSIGRG